MSKKITIKETAISLANEIIDKAEAEREFLYLMEIKDSIMPKDKFLDYRTVKRVSMGYWYNLVLELDWKFTKEARDYIENRILLFESKLSMEEILKLDDKALVKEYLDITSNE